MMLFFGQIDTCMGVRQIHTFTACKTITIMDYPYKMKVTRAIYRDAGFQPENLVNELPHLDTIFDKQGRLLSEIRYDTYGETEAITEHQYDADGRLTLKQEFDNSGEFAEKIAFVYNNAGQLSERRIYYIDDTYDSEIYLYDENGLNTEIRTLDEDGQPESRVLKTYEDGKMTREVLLDAGDDEESSKQIQFDNRGNPVAIEEWSADGNALTKIFYDETNEVIKREIYDEDGELSASWEKLAPGDTFSMAYLESSGEQDVRYFIRNDAAGNEILRQAFDGDDNLLMEVVREYRTDGQLGCQKIHVTGYPEQAPQYYAYYYSYEAV